MCGNIGASRQESYLPNFEGQNKLGEFVSDMTSRDFIVNDVPWVKETMCGEPTFVRSRGGKIGRVDGEADAEHNGVGSAGLRSMFVIPAVDLMVGSHNVTEKVSGRVNNGNLRNVCQALKENELSEVPIRDCELKVFLVGGIRGGFDMD